MLLSLAAVRAGDQGGVCTGVMELMAVLSAAGVRRELLHEAGQAGALADGGDEMVAAGVVDAALARLAEASLLAFSLDGQAIAAHRLVLRVVRDTLVQRGRLAAVCRAAAMLDTHARSGRLPGPSGRPGCSRAGDGLVAGRGRAGRCARRAGGGPAEAAAVGAVLPRRAG